jgi:hypothetical protein
MVLSMVTRAHPSPSRWPRLVAALGLAVLLSGAGLSAAAPARADVNLTVVPSLLDVVADAGASAEQEIQLRNDSAEAVTLDLEVVPPASVPEALHALDWVSIDADRLEIAAGTTATLTVGLDIPGDARSGGHYANIRMTTATSADGTAAALAGEVIVPVLFSVDGDGDVDASAEIGQFAAFLEADGRIGFRAALENTGNVHFRAPGTVELDGPDGERLTTLDLAETTYVLPGQTRMLQAFGTLPLPVGTPFSARIAVDTGAGDPVTAETSFTPADPMTGPLALGICENLDGGPTVTLGMENPDTVGVVPVVRVVVRDAVDALVVDSALPPGEVLWPGQVDEVQAQLPGRLETGAYTMVATVQVGAGQPVETRLPFEIGGTSPATAPLCGI